MSARTGFWLSLLLFVWLASVGTYHAVHHNWFTLATLYAVAVGAVFLAIAAALQAHEEGLSIVKLPHINVSFQTQLSLFTVIMIVHFIEHVAQLGQIHMYRWDRSDALGFVGLAYPWLVQSEVLHYAFAAFMLSGLIYFRRYFKRELKDIHVRKHEGMTWAISGGVPIGTFNPYVKSALDRATQAYRLWNFAMWFQVFHFFEHNILMLQVISGHNLFGAGVPSSLVQALIPQMRAELHFIYTLIATIPMVTASTLRMASGISARIGMRLRALV
jgi:hypothetical protein